ncbi:hypothetical protein H8N00_07595 [Streptomyces sp. AC563]|uniref:hypothetical protein n=1 Tax=Streptomyces buecherae TaxID=2763006 RepID=UPI00164D6349|nr:hypothetical protein [Streptomyces buecherae]MBC3988752.1 hypothetical protein [Streptomyces buecherae]
MRPTMYRTGTPLSVAFYDSYRPNVVAGDYQVRTEQVLDGNNLAPSLREFTVAAPRFAVAEDLVEACHPPPGASGDYRRVAAHVTLRQELLPWARLLDPAQEGKPGAGEPWFCLLVLREEEILRNELIGADGVFVTTAGVDVPRLSDVDGAAAKLTFCRIIEITAETFDRVAPRRDELPFLVHAREVSEQLHTRGVFLDDGEDLREGRFAVAFAGRLPRTDGSYQAHLVSLEGCAGHFGTTGRQPRLRLVSLKSWSFTHRASGHAGFAATMRHLARPGLADPEHGLSLRLPAPAATLPTAAQQRLEQGYVPMSYHTSSGEETFGWYRGPFTARRALDPPWGSHLLECSDAALIYLREDGVYDLSYAAAWNVGRLMVLANADLSHPLTRARSAAWRAMQLTAPDHAAPFAAFRPGPADRPDGPALSGHALVDRLMDRGVGDDVLTTLTAPPALADPPTGTQPPSPTDPAVPPPRAVTLAPALRRGARRDASRRAVRRAVAHHIGASKARADLGTVPDAPVGGTSNTAAHLDEWTLLCAVPFHYLIPDERLLPPESLRFFHVDAAWLQALVDGAVSVGVATTLDSEITEALREAVTNHPKALPCGMLMRSQLVQDIPNLLITASAEDGTTVPGYRRDLHNGVLLLLFADVPDSITVGEPYHGLHFGLDEGDESDQDPNVISLRRLKDNRSAQQGVGQNLGVTLKNVSRFFRPVGADRVADVLRLTNDTDPGTATDDPGRGGLIAALTQALREAGEFDREDAQLCPAEFTLQCVNSPQQMTFTYPKAGART